MATDARLRGRVLRLEREMRRARLLGRLREVPEPQIVQDEVTDEPPADEPVWDREVDVVAEEPKPELVEAAVDSEEADENEALSSYERALRARRLYEAETVTEQPMRPEPKKPRRRKSA